MELESHYKKESYALTRIVLADDHPLMLNALKMWIDEQQDMKVIAEARDGKEAVNIALKLQPDLVIMDVNMPVLNGLEATRQIVSKCPDTEVLIFSFHEDKEHVLSLLKAGAGGYLTKNSTGEEIIHAIRAVVSGESVLPPNITPDDISHALGLAPWQNPKLTPRERQLLQLLATGLPNKQIAANLNLSLRRVKANLTTLFSKMGVASRTEAVSSALKSGILTMEDLYK